MNDAQYSQQALVQLRTAVDRHFEQAQTRQPESMQCRLGCADCCKPGLSVFGLEAHKVQQALSLLRQNAPTRYAQVRAQGQAALQSPSTQQSCPLLVDHQCAVYEERPLICRSHGLPTQLDAQSPVQNCELNFRDEPPQKPSILRLDAVNMPLGVGAQLWQDATQTPLRVSLANLAAADPGSAADP